MIVVILTSAIVSSSLAVPEIPEYDFCVAQSNYVDRVVEQIKEGKTLMHASMLELSKTGNTGIVKSLYSVVDVTDYSEGIKYDWRLDELANKIKKECI